MPNLFNNQYANLASMGRYGDTMLAHINPQEAGLLKSMGGAGTINPQTGLPEFYYMPPRPEPEPLPSLGQILNPDYIKDIPTKLNTITIPEERIGLGGSTPAYEKVSDEYSQYADRSTPSGMGGGRQILGYTVPTDKNIQGQKLSAIYDAKGNFQYLTMAGDQFLTPNTSQPNIIAKPKINAKGELIDAGVFDVNQQDDGGFGSFVGDLVSDFGPMLAVALGANYLAGSGLLGGAGAAGGATAADIAASNALAQANLTGYAGTAFSAIPSGVGTGLLTDAAATAAGASPFSVPTGQLGANIAAADLATAAIDPLAAANISGGLTTEAVTRATAAANAAGGSVTPSMLQTIANATGIDVDTLKTFAPSAITSLLNATGSVLTSDKATEAAKIQSDAQIRAAQIAADAARFRPVGVTTRFGSSNFTTDAAGNVVTAGYTPSAEITGYQDRLRGLAGQGLTDVESARATYAPLSSAAQNLFSLGQGYLAKTPEQAAQEYIAKQTALLAPSRQNQLAELRNRQFQTGRGGVAVSQGGNLMNTNPEMAAYYNSLAQSDLALAAQADQEARNRITYGAGLFDTGAGLQGKYYAGQTAAYSPFTTAMDTSSGLERLAQQPLDLSTSIGQKVSTATADVGRLTGQGIINAAGTMAPANAYSVGGNLLTGAANSPVLSNAVNRAFGNTPPAQQQYTFNPATGQYVPVQQFVA
tara:strand:- start:60 stop:2168 length:2109 start_codon:yes stop_codon:yes gene_type:complete